MAFPLPECPAFRKAVVTFWLEDVDDRLSLNDLPAAEVSWKNANAIYLSLPPGNGDMEIENWIVQQRVKISKRLQATNENNL